VPETNTRSPTVRPFSDAYLLEYSGEHVLYEFEIFLWLGTTCANPSVQIGATSASDAMRLQKRNGERVT
jgi:hypothetical protein